MNCYATAIVSILELVPWLTVAYSWTSFVIRVVQSAKASFCQTNNATTYLITCVLHVDTGHYTYDASINLSHTPWMLNLTKTFSYLYCIYTYTCIACLYIHVYFHTWFVIKCEWKCRVMVSEVCYTNVVNGIFIIFGKSNILVKRVY